MHHILTYKSSNFKCKHFKLYKLNLENKKWIYTLYRYIGFKL